MNTVPFLTFFIQFLNLHCLIGEFSGLVEVMNCSNIISILVLIVVIGYTIHMKIII